jgi:UDP-N-acetylmuramate--alanine ligase
MLVHILRECGFSPGYMIGANVPGGKSSDAGKDDDIFVTEADESDATHKLLSPYLGIVPNVDGDHAWSVGGDEALMENFREFARRSEKVLCFDTETELFSGMKNLHILPENSGDNGFAGHFGFMAQNARLAVESAVYLGCEREQALRAAASYTGIKRRMTLHYSGNDYTVIEDYAHHPNEVKNSIEYLRLKYPEHHLRIVFQPHRYARLEKFFEAFVQVLKTPDSLYVVPVFAAWTESGKVDSVMLAKECGGKYISGSWQENARVVLMPPGDGKKLLIAVLGAGDIEEIIPYLSKQ